MKPFFLMTAAILLTACQSASIHGRPDENSPYFQVPAGSRLVLNKPVEIAAWQNGVYFQDGRSMTWEDVNIYLPYCVLKVGARQAEPRTIHPDTFTVVQSRTEPFFQQVESPVRRPLVQPVAFDTAPRADAEREDGGMMNYEVVASVLDVRAADQPDVTSMICADWGLPRGMVHITVNKMRAALGDFVSIELKPVAP